MSPRSLALLATAVLLAVPATRLRAQHGVKCWQEGGRTVCGDAMPASAAGAATRTYSATGTTLGATARAPTAAEAAAREAAARAAAQAQAARDDIARKEAALAESYESEDALRKAFGTRITTADGAIKTAQSALASQRAALAALLLQAGNAELNGKPVPKPVLGTMAKQMAAVNQTSTALQQQLQVRGGLDAQLAEAVERYRAGKGQPPAAPAAATPAAAPPAAAPVPAGTAH